MSVEIKNILDSIKTLINDPKTPHSDVFELTEVLDTKDTEELVKNDKKSSHSSKVDDNIKRLLEINNKLKGDNNKEQNNSLRPLEQAIIELVKPQLTNWLDLNLNNIVTKVVENEIQKILTNEKKSSG